jgi:hypothetical protein
MSASTYSPVKNDTPLQVMPFVTEHFLYQSTHITLLPDRALLDSLILADKISSVLHM